MKDSGLQVQEVQVSQVTVMVHNLMAIIYRLQMNLWVKISIVCSVTILSSYWQIQKDQDRHQMRLVKREAAIRFHTLPIK